MKLPRNAGILLHITSLPGPYGIGDLGEEGRRFADFLDSAGLKLWQILPLNPTGVGNCPYSSSSAFAGNPLLVSPKDLVKEGLIKAGNLPRASGLSSKRVDFSRVIRSRRRILDQARRNFKQDSDFGLRKEFDLFCRRNIFWLDDYALFVALKGRYKGVPWFKWPIPLAVREEAALKAAARELEEEIEAVKFSQFLFFRQWADFRNDVNLRGVKIVGDIPFFVNQDSADVWAGRRLFLLDKRGRRTALSGVPPPKGGKVGQVWGNPLYNWKEMEKDGYEWWIARFKLVLSLVDIVRIDHFSGFYACWHIPPSTPSSTKGEWVKGPGAKLFRRIRRELGKLPIIAEALEPDVQKPVDRIMREFKIPGVRELQFGLEGSKPGYHHPDKIPVNCAYYTGLHDNDTSLGWYRKLSPKRKRRVLKYLGVKARGVSHGMVREVFNSMADTAIVPLQDPLGLGSPARMNIPGRARGQWEWRFEEEDLTDTLSRDLASLVTGSGR
jgi:4-alpha-glucanotransferase